MSCSGLRLNIEDHLLSFCSCFIVKWRSIISFCCLCCRFVELLAYTIICLMTAFPYPSCCRLSLVVVQVVTDVARRFSTVDSQVDEKEVFFCLYRLLVTSLIAQTLYSLWLWGSSSSWRTTSSKQVADGHFIQQVATLRGHPEINKKDWISLSLETPNPEINKKDWIPRWVYKEITKH